MYTVIRHYAAAPDLVSELQKRSKDVEGIISSVPGFISYYCIRTADGMASVTVCENKSGCDESTQRAGTWLRENLPNMKLTPPTIIAGELAFKFANYKTAV